MRARTLLPLVAFAAAWPAGTGAWAATPFGTNIDGGPADRSFICAQPGFPVFPGFEPQSCTVTTPGRFGDGAGGFAVPNGIGVITQVRIKSGNHPTTPIRIAVLRAQRSPLGGLATCCTGVSETAPFTPQPNATTTLATRIPVRNEQTATGIFEFDNMALTGDAPNAVIPMGTAPGTISGVYGFAVRPGQEAFGTPAGVGDMVPMSLFIWEPDADRDGFGDETQDGCPTNASIQHRVRGRAAVRCPPAPAPPSAPTAPTAPTPSAPTPATPIGPRPLTLSSTSGVVRRGAVTVPLVCRPGAACNGVLRLQSRPATGARAAAPVVSSRRPRRPVVTTYGSASYRIAAGRRRSVRVALTRAGRALLTARRRSATVYANTVVRGRVLSMRFTLRRP